MPPPVAYVTTADGVRIAWATHGRGRPLLSLPPIPFRHLELEWESPEDRRWLERVAARHLLVQYDPRGMGLSQRGAVDYSFDALLLDLDAVVANITEPVALFAAVNTGPLAIAYAARHPDRVSHLLLWCTSPRAGETVGPYLDALIDLIGHDWELASETAGHVLRGWSAGDSARRLAALLRAAVDPETIRQLYQVVPAVDATALLPAVRAPTLVLHRRELTWLPLSCATELASGIPGARLVVLEGASMAPWAGDVDVLGRIVDEFLGVSAASEAAPFAGGDAFRREGEYWTLAFAGRVCRVRDAKGLHHLAHLLRQPGVAVPAMELFAALAEPDAGTGAGADLGPVLDARAKAAYRARVEALRAEAAEADMYNDPARAAAARAEIDAVTEQLAAAIGLGGRARRIGAASERVRLTVTKRIKDALSRIRRAHPTLGEHLSRSIRTGLICVYQPDASVRWTF